MYYDKIAIEANMQEASVSGVYSKEQFMLFQGREYALQTFISCNTRPENVKDETPKYLELSWVLSFYNVVLLEALDSMLMKNVQATAFQSKMITKGPNGTESRSLVLVPLSICGIKLTSPSS